MSYETPWRSLGDPNPCFRRERATRIASEPCRAEAPIDCLRPNLASHRSGATWVPWNVNVASLFAGVASALSSG